MFVNVHRSESPSQVFIIVISWLMEVLKHLPIEQWKDVVIAYDNMCQLCGMKAAQSPLPSIKPPFNEMWLKVTKIVDSLHFRNHVDPKCCELYNPAKVKEQHPKYNTMAAEQTFVWLSRYKQILSATNKTHHCFMLHRLIYRHNRYLELCHIINRKPLLPKSNIIVR